MIEWQKHDSVSLAGIQKTCDEMGEMPQAPMCKGFAMNQQTFGYVVDRYGEVKDFIRKRVASSPLFSFVLSLGLPMYQSEKYEDWQIEILEPNEAMIALLEKEKADGRKNTADGAEEKSTEPKAGFFYSKKR